VTVVVTAVVFGVYHVEPGPAAACTVMGLVLGWLRHRTGSIWPAVVMHATNNLLVGSGMLWYWCTR
jgi:membrane protease YdiL (CAAX protease family)